MKWSSVLVTFLVVAGCAGIILPLTHTQDEETSPTVGNSPNNVELGNRGPASVPEVTPSPPKPTANARTLAGPGNARNTNPRQREDEVVNQLYSASMAFSAPDKANIKENITIQLLIDPSKEVKELEERLTKPGVRRGAKIKISKVIIATLSAPDFTIEQITPEEQAVAQTAPTEWLWTLIPKTIGSNDVKLTVTAVIKVDGREHKYHIKTYERTIVIEVTPQQIISNWFAKYWQWLFSTLLLPLGLWLYKRRKKE